MNSRRQNFGGNRFRGSGSSANVVDFAFLSILSIALVNVSASLATLTFWAAVWGAQIASDLAGSAAGSFRFFGFGVLAALASGGAGYFAQYFYEQGGRLPRGSVMRGVWGGLGIYSHCVALLAAAAGIIGFVWGAWQGITALQGTNGGVTKQSLFNFVGSAFG